MSGEVGRLHVITDEVLQSRWTHAQLAGLAAAGGADTIQFREKRARTTRELIETAEAMTAAMGDAESTLLIDDRVDVAAAVGGAFGGAVHLGRDDLPAELARRLLGDQAIIGGTANSLEEARGSRRRRSTIWGWGRCSGRHRRVIGRRRCWGWSACERSWRGSTSR